MLTLADIKQHGETFTKEIFDLNVKPCTFHISSRLKNAQGKCVYNILFRNGEIVNEKWKIIISKEYLENNPDERVLKVLEHEMVHYALSRLRKPYKDRDDYFKETCRRLDIPLKTSTSTDNLLTNWYACSCREHCSRTRFRKTRTCNTCKQPLVFLERAVFDKERINNSFIKKGK